MNAYTIPGIKKESIELIASKIWDIDFNELKSKTRKREVVECRHVLMNYRNMVLKQTLQKSGSYYKKDHSTVLNSNKKVQEFLCVDPVFKKKYNEFHQKVKDI